MEIGSEYWLDGMCVTNQCDPKSKVAWLLSGRTALDFIVQDIKASRNLETIYLPSYCCKSMIEPFVRNNVRVKFYRVASDRIDYDDSNTADAVLLLDYFGYEMPENEGIVKSAHDAGKVVIYDATHKLNGNPTVEKYAHYSFCSYRKWFYCNSAKVEKHGGDFLINKPDSYHTTYCETRDRAARLKTEYIGGRTNDKAEFLRLYSAADELLDCSDYQEYAGEPVSFNLESIIEARRWNAGRLISGLSDISGVKLWRNNVEPTDAPLFVPILVSPEIRNLLKQYLIQHSIYIPVHWQKTDLHGDFTNVYDWELSLICDQRYGIKDMDREIEVIRDFFLTEK